MGVSFNAYAGLGVVIDRSRLYEKKKVRLCGHPAPPARAGARRRR
jgi:hypothetical protein